MRLVSASPSIQCTRRTATPTPMRAKTGTTRSRSCRYVGIQKTKDEGQTHWCEVTSGKDQVARRAPSLATWYLILAPYGRVHLQGLNPASVASLSASVIFSE